MKSQFAFPFVGGGSQSDSAIAFFVNGTIVMVYNALIINDKRFVSKNFIVGFGGFYQVGAGPVCPVDQIVGAGEAVEGSMGPFPEGPEVEQDVNIAYFL